MSCYDEITFKPFTDKKVISKTSHSDKDFKEKFCSKYNGLSKDQIKNMINCNNSDLFDFFYSDEYVSSQFFDKQKNFGDNFDQQIDFMLSFLKEKYSIITPNILKEILIELGINSSASSDAEYCEMIHLISKNPVINLSSHKDLLRFKYFLQGKDPEKAEDELKFPQLKNIEAKSEEKIYNLN